MCGISGCFSVAKRKETGEISIGLKAMTEAIAHRGPDGAGEIILQEDDAFVLGLGHRRLSIIDLSSAGAQPMASHDERYLIVFNGEIYNFADLRSELEIRRGEVSWRGHSDTEVLLELVADQGLEKALTRLDGMFALALFDRYERTLTLARDPFGEKPLYYGFWDGVFLFGSELKALRAWPSFAPSQSLSSTAAYFKYGYVPAPETIFEGIYKLQAANCLKISVGDLYKQRLPSPYIYWDMVGTAVSARSRGFSGDYKQAVEEVYQLLILSTRRRMVSDVPVGCLLSGGIDSSLTAALMQQVSTSPVHTFTIGMHEHGYNEADHATAVSKYLGTQHTQLILTPQEVQSIVPDIAKKWDEPFADSSQIPTYLVAAMARKHVTVVLSGDGGDELFSGYNRYFYAPHVWSAMSRFPTVLRSSLSAAVGIISPAKWNQLTRFAGRFAPIELSEGRGGEKIHKLARLLSAETLSAYHDQLLTTGDPTCVLDFSSPYTTLPTRIDGRILSWTFAEQAMLLDSANYLPDDVLTKVDRASMSIGLETRTPFLNKELFEFAWRLPMCMKTRQNMGKLVLRSVLEKKVPRQLFNRPKAGFAIPVGRWLNGSLRDWAESQLSVSSLNNAGIFDVKKIRKIWLDHTKERENNESMIWALLMYLSWLNR